MNIVVLAGGLSTERDVSLSTGGMVCRALKELGHRVRLLDVYLGMENFPQNPEELFEAPEIPAEILPVPDTAPDLSRVRALRRDGGRSFFGPNVVEILKAADLAFLALHGSCGEDGRLQAALDLLGVPYTGSSSLGSALAMDKDVSKTLFRSAGIPTAKWTVVHSEDEREQVVREIGLPCVVKPRSGGSSVGVFIAKTQSELTSALREALACDSEVLVEQFVKGREFSVGILNGEALPAIEIVPREGFYDYRNKYQPGLSEEICPARLDPEKAEKLGRIALKAHRALRLGSYSRVDFILGEDGTFFCLEANNLPGLTPTSLLPQEALADGISYRELCRKIIGAVHADSV